MLNDNYIRKLTHSLTQSHMQAIPIPMNWKMNTITFYKP